MMASGEAVPLTALEGVTANQAETLAEHDIKDVEALASANLDNLVEYLDLTYDEAQAMITAAAAIVAAKDTEVGAGDDDPAKAEAAVETESESMPEAEEVSETSESSEEPAEDLEVAETESEEEAEADKSEETAEITDEPVEGDATDSKEGTDVKDV